MLDPEIATVSQEQAALSLRETLAEWRDVSATEQVLKKILLRARCLSQRRRVGDGGNAA